MINKTVHKKEIIFPLNCYFDKKFGVFQVVDISTVPSKRGDRADSHFLSIQSAKINIYLRHLRWQNGPGLQDVDLPDDPFKHFRRRARLHQPGHATLGRGQLK